MYFMCSHQKRISGLNVENQFDFSLKPSKHGIFHFFFWSVIGSGTFHDFMFSPKKRSNELNLLSNEFITCITKHTLTVPHARASKFQPTNIFINAKQPITGPFEFDIGLVPSIWFDQCICDCELNAIAIWIVFCVYVCVCVYLFRVHLKCMVNFHSHTHRIFSG